jgi:hypothetical protein
MASSLHKPWTHKLLQVVTKHPARLLEVFQIFWIALILFRMVWSFGGYIWIGTPLQQAGWMILVLAIAHGLYQILRHDTLKFRLSALLPLPFLLVAGWKGLVASPAEWAGALHFYVLLDAYIIYWVVLHLQRTHRDGIYLLSGAIAVSVLAMIGAYYQYYFYPDWFMNRTVRSDSIERASGLMANPDHFGLFCVLLLPFLAVGAWMRRFPGPGRILLGVLCLAVLNSIMISGGRGAIWAVLVCALLLPFFAVRRWKYRLRGFVVMLLLCALFGGITWWQGSEGSRHLENAFAVTEDPAYWPAWQAGVEQWKRNPVSGGGLGSVQAMWESLRPEGHNSLSQGWVPSAWIGIIAETGVIGLLAILLPFGYLFSRIFSGWKALPYEKLSDEEKQRMTKVQSGRRRKRKSSEKRHTPVIKVMLTIMLVTMVVLTAVMFFDDPLRVPALAFLLAIFLGISAWAAPMKDWAFPNNRMGRWTLFIVPVLLASWQFRAVPTLAEAQWLVIRSASVIEHELQGPERIFNRPSVIAEANANLAIALRLNPRHSEALVLKARGILAMQHAELYPRAELASEAIRFLDIAIAQAPHNWRAYQTYAEAIYLDRGVDPAMEYYLQKALELAPYRAEVHSLYGWLHYRHYNNRAEARRFIDRALELNPQYAPARRYRSALVF